MSEETDNEPDLHEWRREFDGSKAPLQGENEIYLDTFTKINPDTDDITLFTDAGDPSKMPNEEADNIVGFCRYVKTSEAFERTAHERLVAIVHDFDSAGKSRAPRSPLTVRQLRDVLSVPVSS